MKIFPAIDLYEKKAVRLLKGEYEKMTVYSENPEKVARKWEDMGAEVVHVIDLDGALESTTNIETIKKVLDEVSVPIQLGGGIRSIEYAEELLNLDIDRLIIGTMGIKNPETITKLSDEYGL